VYVVRPVNHRDDCSRQQTQVRHYLLSYVKRRKLAVREGIRAGSNPDWESLTCASATILKLVAL
jgi:hypothetical protein